MIFGLGGHDNGYASTLNYLQTEGLLEKVTLLRGYEVLAKEVRSLNLPQLQIEGVFMTKKLHSKSPSKLSLLPIIMPPLEPKDFEIFKTSSRSAPDSLPSTTKSHLAVTQVVYVSEFNVHYLSPWIFFSPLTSVSVVSRA